jgi:hypothetical protein
MTSKADEYRAKARDAKRLAELACETDVKEQALKIAQEWLEMAAREEKRGWH